MKNNSPNDDEKLRATLREWKEHSPLPPRFQEQVWQRIEKAEAVQKIPLNIFFAHWLERAFARPSFAVAYLAILLIAGTSAGYFQAQRHDLRLNKELGTRYVQSIDPYQKLAHR